MTDVTVTLPADRDVIVLDNGQPAQIATALIDKAIELGLPARVVRVQPYVGGFVAPASVVSEIDVTPEPPTSALGLERTPTDEPYTAGPPFTLRLTLATPLVEGQSLMLLMGVNGGSMMEYPILRTDVSPTVFEWSIATENNAGGSYVYEVILWGMTGEEGRSNQVTATIIA